MKFLTYFNLFLFNNNLYFIYKNIFMKNKCFFCNKKINLVETTTNKCKCNNIFCTKHFFYLSHNCNFDYNLDNINKLSSNIINYSEIENKIIKI